MHTQAELTRVDNGHNGRMLSGTFTLEIVRMTAATRQTFSVPVQIFIIVFFHNLSSKPSSYYSEIKTVTLKELDAILIFADSPNQF